MRDDDEWEDRFLAAFSELCVQYSKQPRSEEMRRLAVVWMKKMRRLDAEVVEQLFEEAANSLKFFPRTSELNEILIGKYSTQAHDAWGEVRRSITSVGHYQSVDFGEVSNAVVRALGGTWPMYLRLFYSDQAVTFEAQRFRELWVEYAKSGIPEGRGTWLVGEHKEDEPVLRLPPGVKPSPAPLSIGAGRKLLAAVSKGLGSMRGEDGELTPEGKAVEARFLALIPGQQERQK